VIFTRFGVPVKIVGARRLHDGGFEVDCDSLDEVRKARWTRHARELKADGGMAEIVRAAELYLYEEKHVG
jgi:hypothetical protein